MDTGQVLISLTMARSPLVFFSLILRLKISSTFWFAILTIGNSKAILA